MTLTNGVSRRSIAVGGVGHWGEGVRVGSVEVSWLGVSAPLAQSLGAPGNEGGGGSGVSSNSGQAVSVAVGVAVGSVTQTVVTIGTIVGISLWLSISLSLVETMNGLVAGSRKRSSVSRGVVRSVESSTVWGIIVQSISLWLSISAPLAIGSAAIAG